MTAENELQCFLVRKLGKGQIDASLERRPTSELPVGDVLIRVKYSSLNYKDALAATGHRGVVTQFPHVPGIDAAGVVVESGSTDFTPGQEVLVTSYELGAERWGGWANYVRVPADWVIALPAGLTLRQAMIYGTAGLTAGLSVNALLQAGVRPEHGDILVTGASGGVGTIAVALLAKLGFRVTAVSGKTDRYSWLKELGATHVVGRNEIQDTSGKPLLAARWAGAVDSVGGHALATILRSMQQEGCVTACGLVGGTDLPLTVYPFILRGVTLAGIDSAWCARERRLSVWNHLASDWKLDQLDALGTTVPLQEIRESVQQILQGAITGRTVVEIPE